MLDKFAGPAVFTGGLIRLGNFMNGEIIGLPSNGPLSIIFTNIDTIPRHPAQLYEACFYFACGIFISILHRKYKSQWFLGKLSGYALILCFSGRFLLEFFKPNQSAISHNFFINMGQLLSIPMIILGIFLLFNIQNGKRILSDKNPNKTNRD